MDKPQGGGGTLIFFFIRRLRPSIYCSPPPPPNKNKQTCISSTPNKYLKFKQPKNILHSVPWPSEKTLKCIEMISKYSPICDDPPPPPNLLKPPHYIEIHNFNPQK